MSVAHIWAWAEGWEASRTGLGAGEWRARRSQPKTSSRTKERLSGKADFQQFGCLKEAKYFCKLLIMTTKALNRDDSSLLSLLQGQLFPALLLTISCSHIHHAPPFCLDSLEFQVIPSQHFYPQAFLNPLCF